MFKKLVTSVTLSPSAIGELVSYSKKLRSQLPLRIAGTLLLLGALILELVIIYIPTSPVMPEKRTPIDVVVTKNTKSLMYTQETRNISQGNADATKKPAQPSDQLIYTLTVVNKSEETQEAQIYIDLKDVFDYASLLGNNDASLNGTILSWPTTSLEPNESQARTFTIKMVKDISTAPSNGLAFDCKMSTAFGDVQDNVVRCSTVKSFNTEVNNLPVFNNATSITILTVVLTTSLLLLLRNIQQCREIAIIRKLLSEGEV